MLDSLSKELFASLLNTTFLLHDPSFGHVKLELVEFQDLAEKENKRVQTGWETFSLLFQGPHDPPVLQRLYPMEHDQTGAFELFIVPVGRDAKGRLYEAIFNRPIPSLQDA